MIRIKYTEIGNLLQTDWFTLGPNFIVRGVINTLDNSYQIIEFNSDILDKGLSSNLRQSKYKLKLSLVNVGVNFEDEIRKG